MKQIINNIAFLIILDLVALPAALMLYLFHGFHIIHVVLGVAYIYGVFSVFKTANLILKRIKYTEDFSNSESEHEEGNFEGDFSPLCQDTCGSFKCGCHANTATNEEDSPKPEMKKALDDVFNLTK